MADTKISALPAASALSGAEEFAVNQGGTSKKATATQVGAFAADAIDGTTITNVTITGTSDFNAGTTGTSRVSIRADYGPVDLPSVLFEIAGDTSDRPPYIVGGFDGANEILMMSAGRDTAGSAFPRYQITRDPGVGSPAHEFSDGSVRIGADGLEVQGPLTADTFTPLDGSVGTGTFRDSVDARAAAISAARMQAGTVSSGTMVAGTVKQVAVTYPTAFSSAPKVVVSPVVDPASTIDRRIWVVPGSETTTGFTAAFLRATGTGSFDANWIAVKP